MATQDNKRYKAVRSDALSSSRDIRFVIIDSETGEVKDDAQGYGYKSPRKAYAAWGYKNRTPEEKQREEEISSWLCDNRPFDKRMTQCSFYAFEDMVDFTAKDVESLLEEGKKEGYLKGDIPGTPSEILRVWKRGTYYKKKRKKKK